MKYLVSGCNARGEKVFEVLMSNRPRSQDIQALVQGSIKRLDAWDGGFVVVDGAEIAAVGVSEYH